VHNEQYGIQNYTSICSVTRLLLPKNRALPFYPDGRKQVVPSKVPI